MTYFADVLVPLDRTFSLPILDQVFRPAAEHGRFSGARDPPPGPRRWRRPDRWRLRGASSSRRQPLLPRGSGVGDASVAFTLVVVCTVATGSGNEALLSALARLWTDFLRWSRRGRLGRRLSSSRGAPLQWRRDSSPPGALPTLVTGHDGPARCDVAPHSLARSRPHAASTFGRVRALDHCILCARAFVINKPIKWCSLRVGGRWSRSVTVFCVFHYAIASQLT